MKKHSLFSLQSHKEKTACNEQYLYILVSWHVQCRLTQSIQTVPMVEYQVASSARLYLQYTPHRLDGTVRSIQRIHIKCSTRSLTSLIRSYIFLFPAAVPRAALSLCPGTMDNNQRRVLPCFGQVHRRAAALFLYSRMIYVLERCRKIFCSQPVCSSSLAADILRSLQCIGNSSGGGFMGLLY